MGISKHQVDSAFTMNVVERKKIEEAFQYLKNVEMTGEMVLQIISNIPKAQPNIIVEYPDWIVDAEGAYSMAILLGKENPIEFALQEALEKNRGK